MRIEWTSERVTFSEMDGFMAEMLRKIPVCAASSDDQAKARIFPSPTNSADKSADEDWREHVVPELAELFRTHLDVVASDLAAMESENGTFKLTFPPAHARDWIHALNQARIALGATHGVTEDDMEGRKKTRSSEKSHALFLIDIYEFFLTLLLNHAEL